MHIFKLNIFLKLLPNITHHFKSAQSIKIQFSEFLQSDRTAFRTSNRIPATRKSLLCHPVTTLPALNNSNYHPDFYHHCVLGIFALLWTLYKLSHTVWHSLFWLNSVFVRLIHVTVYSCSSSCLLWNIPPREHTSFIPSIDGQLDSAVMNILTHVFWWMLMHISIGYI